MRKKKHRSRSQKHQQRRQFSQKKTRWVGRVQKNPRGFAFVIPQDGTQKDTYISSREARALMNGDIVEYQVLSQGKRREGQIVRILERACKKVLGRVEKDRNRFFLESAEGDFLELENVQAGQVGSWVIAKVTDYPDLDQPGLARVEELLGSQLKPEHDHLITISRFGIEENFPSPISSEILDVRLAATQEIRNPDPARKDLRKIPFVTIDGEDAKDFDDAISVVENSGADAFTLRVAIADVSFFVRPGSRLDEEAQRRSTSIYFPGYCIPMLPEGLSNDLCSLNPQTDKLVLVAEIIFDHQGKIRKTHFYEGIINTLARLTYTRVHQWFEGQTGSIPDSCQELLKSSKKLFEILSRLRKERGVLDFQLPECRFELDKLGHPLKALPFPQWEAHRLIEEFMIMANSVVAKKLTEHHCPSLYRVHEAPMIETIEELNHLMKSLGFSTMLKEVSPLAFSAILASTAGQKGSKTLHKAILRAQKQARYEPEPKGHFGLALKDYTHFTSPIRRYPDLVVHRALKRFILPNKFTDKDNNSEELVRLGEITSERERRAMEAERFIVRRKQCWFMRDRLGEILSGTISGIISKGFFVEIEQFAIEGFVPLESLSGMYEFDERRGCLRRRPGHSTIHIGDKIDIQVVLVDIENNEITFSPAEKNL